jgi:hypothetical protein
VAVDDRSQDSAVDIDLASGVETPVPTRTEYWFDDERKSLRGRLSIGGETLPGGEFLQTPDGFFTDLGRRDSGPPQLNPMFEHFARGYREALESGEATVVGEEIIDGRNADILRLETVDGPSGKSYSVEVAVDSGDYRPIAFRFPSIGIAVPWSAAARVVAAEMVVRDPRDFERPEASGPRPARITSVGERRLAPAEAATALGTTALWAGPSVRGLELSEIELSRVTIDWTNHEETTTSALDFDYGEGLQITEATSPHTAPSFGQQPPEGRLRLRGAGAADGQADIWFGQLQRDGLFIHIRAPQRETVVAAAKKMEPMR